MINIFKVASAAGIVAVLTPIAAFAHVVVTPSQANVGDTVAFSIAVPNERTSNLTSITLDIPRTVNEVTPNVDAGWNITTQKDGDNVTSVTWTGTIPAGQRADLLFTAQVPAEAGEVDWKAHQTYEDGTVVNWDQTPTANEGDNDAATSGPYSVTRIVNDLAQNTSTATTSSTTDNATFPLILSAIAIIFSLFSLFMRRRKA